MKSKKLRLWDGTDPVLGCTGNYAGTEFPGYYCGPVRTRDSEILQHVNFNAALEMLGGESETVKITRSGHWAVGWTEQILVKATAADKVKLLEKIHDDLTSYAILDEEAYFRAVEEAKEKNFKEIKSELEDAMEFSPRSDDEEREFYGAYSSSTSDDMTTDLRMMARELKSAGLIKWHPLITCNCGKNLRGIFNMKIDHTHAYGV